MNLNNKTSKFHVFTPNTPLNIVHQVFPPLVCFVVPEYYMRAAGSPELLNFL